MIATKDLRCSNCGGYTFKGDTIYPGDICEDCHPPTRCKTCHREVKPSAGLCTGCGELV